MLDRKSKFCLLAAKFFSASFYVFEMLIFGKLMKRRFQWCIGFPTFLLLPFLCVRSSKICPEGSILTEPPLTRYSPGVLPHLSSQVLHICHSARKAKVIQGQLPASPYSQQYFFKGAAQSLYRADIYSLWSPYSARSKFWGVVRVGGQGWGWQQYPIH